MSVAPLKFSEADLPRLAQDFALSLRPGEIVCVSGPLGAGKTTFLRHVVAALGVTADEAVCSPTFAIRNEYAASAVEIIHMDFYRLERTQDVEHLDLWSGTGEVSTLTFIEWGEKFAEYQARYTRTVLLDYDATRTDGRTISITPAHD